MQKIKTFFLNKFSVLSLVGFVIGGIGGYLYYYFIGCNSGTCPIQSNPILSVIWGALLGYLLLDMFKKRKSQEKKAAEE